MSSSSTKPSSSTASSSRRAPILPLVADGLYVVLSRIDRSTRKFHWGLYLAYDEISGQSFHITDTYRRWRYESSVTSRLTFSESVIVALKIAVIEEDIHKEFTERVGQVAIQEGFTCRLWVLEAMRQLDSEGWISLTASVQDLQNEAVDLAIENIETGVRSVEKSSHCRR